MSDPKLRPGTNHCKCAACGEYFTSDSSFRMHRATVDSRRVCRDPATIIDKDRKPRLRRTDTGLWASARRRVEVPQQSDQTSAADCAA